MSKLTDQMDAHHPSRKGYSEHGPKVESIPTIQIIRRPTNPDLIKELSDLLKQAEAGEITGMAGVFTVVNRKAMTCIVGDQNTDTFKLLGQVAYLQSRVLARIQSI